MTSREKYWFDLYFKCQKHNKTYYFDLYLKEYFKRK